MNYEKMFNKGFLCTECGPIPAANKRSISKVSTNCCPNCSKPVKAWERPLNERPGRCGNCSYGSFKSAYVNRHLLRCCKRCDEVVDIDNGLKLIRKGAKV